MNEVRINKILLDREKKKENIEVYLNKFDVVSLKANIVGINKNIYQGNFLVNYFDKIICNLLSGFSFKNKYQSYDGTYILYMYPKGLFKDLKDKAIKIEELNPLGRLIDIDVYCDTLNSISRGYMRKCLICDDYAFVCNRVKRHSDEELLNKMELMIYDELEKNIKECLDKAIELELALPYKFGCVCLDSKGSHKDMDFLVMRRAKEAIIPYFLKMLDVSFNEINLESLFKKVRNIGLEAEKTMFEKTNGVNCYKGLIFLLGLLVTSIGYSIKNDCYHLVFENIKIMTRDLKNELNCNNTNGLIAYQKYKFNGARHEAMSGLRNVDQSYKMIDNLSIECLEKVLINIILNIDDTVMLKRCGTIEKYQEIKELIKNINNLDELIKVNNYCINENISVGGACDILICSIFIKLLNEKIEINGESYA